MNVEFAKKVADEIRAALPEQAAKIDLLIAEAQAKRQDMVDVQVGIKYKLEKFAGDYVPGMQPVEVIEGTDTLS